MENRIDARFSGLESSVGEIKNALSRINWAIILCMVAGLGGSMLKGGFDSKGN